MPLSAVSLLNTYSGLKSNLSEKAIPDYAVLFWHNVHNWDDVNSTHGSNPITGGSTRHFRISQLGNASPPDIASFYTAGVKPSTNFNYTVRCVSSNTSWPTICDLSFAANTNMPTNQSTLLDVGGIHNVTLPGRTFPPLPNDGGTTFTVVPITLYNASHTGHVHQVEGLYDTLMALNPGNTDTFLQSNNSYAPKNYASFFVSPIIKDPKIYSAPVKKIPKDMIVMYYGGATLPLDYYDQYDITVSSNNQLDVSANGLCLPITFRNALTTSSTNIDLDVGVKNKIITNGSFIVGNNSANIASFITSSNNSGYHDHRVLGVSTRLITDTPAISYTVIPISGKSTIFPSTNINEPYPNGPDTIDHKHKVTYKTELKLKSNKLTAYLSKSPNAPIVNGLIIGYSIGKHSGFDGVPTTGSEILPKGWYFCDGQNGTPDLRGKYPFLNFTQDGITGVDENATSTLEIKEIEVETINWKHGHVYKQTTATPVAGAAGVRDVGSHASNYDPLADTNNTTRHSHAVSTAGTFTQKSPTGTNLLNRPNAKVGSSVLYEPPTVEIAFIMYNDTI
jgi:hypothetical protein